ncbi:RloB-like protein [Sphingopyxis sp. YR583]|nr:RloB-like protein [Sphingopyxis sp. YR583]
MRAARSLKRRVNLREPKRRFVIYTEGKNTEPDYFRAIRKASLGALIDIEIVEAAGVPATIAKKASADAKARSRRGRARSSFEETDEVWAVFDRDEHPHVEEALARCRAAKVGTAFSDPCFEIWLILHHGDFDRPDNRHEVQAECAKRCAGYDPKSGKTADCDALMPLVAGAEKRAAAQLARRMEEGNPPGAPLTTVFELTRSIGEAHAAHQDAN